MADKYGEVKGMTPEDLLYTTNRSLWLPGGGGKVNMDRAYCLLAKDATDAANAWEVDRAALASALKQLERARKYVATLIEFGDDETGRYYVGDNRALDDLRANLPPAPEVK